MNDGQDGRLKPEPSRPDFLLATFRNVFFHSFTLITGLLFGLLILSFVLHLGLLTTC
jgi:hypothetical protein